MKNTFPHCHVIAIIVTGLLLTTLFVPAAGGYEIVGWGDNGEGATTSPDGNNFTAVAANGNYDGDYSLALKSDGSIVGWGRNDHDQATPPTGNNFIAISPGWTHSIALKSDGSIIGWGWDNGGQATPPTGNDFTAIAAGAWHCIALKSDGSIVGWGNNGHGEATFPTENDFTAIAAGAFYSLALKSDGSIVGFGYNDYGQATPPTGNNFTAIAAGYNHGLALKSDGSIVGWGNNDYGQITPPTGKNFTAIAAGTYYSIALKSDGSIVCWGNNNSGQTTPPAGNNFAAIAAGGSHSLALQEVSPNILTILKCTVTAGIKDNSDKISFSGTMNATADDFDDANGIIEITIESNDIVYPCTLTFPINDKTFKKGKYSYSGADGSVKKSFTYNPSIGKFAFAVGNVDLSGLDCPITIRIEIGGYIGTAEVDETIANGPKTPMPILLMMGFKNTMRVDKCTVKQNNKKTNSDQLTVKGAFAVEDTSVNMNEEEFIAALGAQTFTLPIGNFNAKGVNFICSKVHTTEVDGGTASATFNFKLCSFILTINSANIPPISGDTDFGMTFADFNEIELVTIH